VAAWCVSLILVSLLLPAAMYGQAPDPQSEASRAAAAIARVQHDDLGVGPVDALSFVNVIADARAVQGIPVLEQYYGRTQDPEIKAGVASALVRLGDKDDSYWAYLVTLASPSLDSDVPDSTSALSGKESDISPELKAWAGAHHLTVEAAVKLLVFDLPSHLVPLARTGNPRGIPLLRRALASPNTLIASTGAAGLAQAQDADSIPLIIAACKRTPPFWGTSFADSLLFFDDPRAQRTFVAYFPDVNVAEARKFRRYRPWGGFSTQN